MTMIDPRTSPALKNNAKTEIKCAQEIAGKAGKKYITETPSSLILKPRHSYYILSVFLGKSGP